MRRHQVHIQDGYLFEWLKSRKHVSFELITGSVVVGQVHGFDRYCIMVAVEDCDDYLLIYKHAVASIGSAAADARFNHHDRGRREMSRRRPRAAVAEPGRVAVVGGRR